MPLVSCVHTPHYYEALACTPSVPLAAWIFAMAVGMTINKYLPQKIFE